MMTPTDPRDIFQQEAQDLLALLETTLLDLERQPDDAELIATAFRALHTIKGSGAMFGFDAVAAFTHHVETAFDRVRQGKMAPNRDLIALTLRARDHMRALIEDAEADAGEGAAILAELATIVDEPAASDEAAAPETFVTKAPAAAGLWRIRMRLPRDAMANGTNPVLLIDELKGLGEAEVCACIDEVPSLEEIDPAGCYVAWEISLRTVQPRQTIEDVFLFVRDEMELVVEAIDEAAPVEPLAEAVTACAALDAVKVKPAETPAEAPREAGKSAAAINAASIRVPAFRLDELMERVGELVITQSRLRQIGAVCGDNQVLAVSEEIERLVLELRDTTMGIRMVPIGSLFGRFRRVVHDLSRDLGKQVNLVMQGEETELDKTVIEQLNDPLVHMIRNAMDHGLEDPDEREALGKTRVGRMELSATHAGTEVLIRLSDDGRGLDRARIRARAVERGLIAADAPLSDNELFQLLFLPGFSTAKEVTSLSGRGVGMDVVRRTVESLRGHIDISSQPGAGTVVTLRLPLTLAIIDGLLVRVGNSRYVVPLAAVEECVELGDAEETGGRGMDFLSIRGDLVPFLRLRDLFKARTTPDPFQKVVIVSSAGQRVGLVVDQVIGHHQTVIKSLSKLHARIAMFSGATILGDGAVALILDVPNLVAYGQSREEKQKVA
jgi:two-component system chemotaxis sensor kinase CheA